MLLETQAHRVFCIVPPSGKLVREDRCQTPVAKLKTIALRPPIDLMYAAAAYEAAGCELRLIDCPAEEEGLAELESRLKEFKPHDILLSITTVSLRRDIEVADFIRRVLPKARIAAKGAHFNVLDVQTLKRTNALDLVLWGEYEHTCFELGKGTPLSEVYGISYRTEAGEIIRNPARPFEKNLDKIAFPARHLSNNTLYRRPDTNELQTTLVTNRGCPFHCVYCLANQVAGSRNRHRSVANIIKEIEECIELHGIRNFLFRSELFTQDQAWVQELCAAIIDGGIAIEWACNSRVDTVSAEMLSLMKRAGCWIMAFGVESGDQETLDRLKKRSQVEDAFKALRLLKQSGIKSSIYLLIGLPWDDRQSIEQQADFACALEPDVLEVFYAYPFPGTALHKQALKEGLLEESTDFPEDAYSDPVMPTRHLSITELKGLRKAILRKFYLRPKKIIDTLWGARSFKEFKNYAQLGVAQLRSIMAA